MYGNVQTTRTFMFAAVLVLAAGPAPAKEAAKAPPKWMESCQTDLHSLCKEDKDKATPAACLKAHEKDLSPTCRDAFLLPYNLMEQCQPDINRFCKKPAGHIGPCLLRHRIELAPECREAVLAAEKTFPPEPVVTAPADDTKKIAAGKKRAAKRKKKTAPKK